MMISRISNQTLIYLIAIIILGTFVFYFGYKLNADVKNYSGTAQEGVFDLSNWDADEYNYIALKGEWEFFYKELYHPKDFAHKNIDANHHIVLPGIWNGFVYKGENIPGEGWATYRLKIKLKSDGHYALRIKELDCAYKLWVNGKDSVDSGIIGTTSETETPDWRRNEIFFLTDNKEIDIVLQVSNFNHRKGGAEDPIILASYKDIYHYKLIQISIAYFMLGFFVLMSIYHFVLFMYRRKDLSILFFAIFNILIALRLGTTGEKVLLDIFQSLPWGIAIRTEYLSYTLCSPTILAFFRQIYPKLFSKTIFQIVLWLTITTSAIILFTPSTIFSYTPVFYQIILAATAAYIFIVLIIASIKNRENALIFFGGYFILFLTIINDLLYFNKAVESSFLIPFGLFVMIFSQAFILAKKSSQAFRNVEILSESLEEYNVKLEETVKERTQKIAQQNIELEKSYSDLQKMNKFKEEMTSIIIHDLKNPLNMMVNIPNNTEHFRYRAMINNAVSSMLNLISNVLYVNKMSNASNPIKKEEVYISKLFNSVFQDSKYLLEQKNIRLVVNSYTDYLLLLDKEMISRVLFNLISNAIKFSPPNSKIEISVSDENPYVKIHVCDEGEGVEESDFTHIFEKYKTGSKKKQQNSSGLGLAFCKMAIEEHHGVIGVNSNPSKGATFWFKLKYQHKALQLEKKQYITNNTLDIDALNSEELKIVQPMMRQLLDVELYDISSIKMIISDIEKHNIPALKNFLNQLLKAAEFCNEDEFYKLIELICPKEKS